MTMVCTTYLLVSPTAFGLPYPWGLAGATLVTLCALTVFARHRHI